MKKHTLKGAKGFTLAEVLTTLMVIGVVAAMTIPSLYNSYKEQADITLMKKANAVYTSFVKSFIAENMLLSDSDVVNFYANEPDCSFLKKYFHTAGEIETQRTGPRRFCIFTTPDGLIWEFNRAMVDEKTNQDALLTKVYLPKKKNIKINGEEVKIYDTGNISNTSTDNNKPINYFYFYFHMDRDNIWINEPAHTPWGKWPGSEYCGSHPFGNGCWNGNLNYTQQENLYHQFINKEYTQYNWNF